jgi:tetratricopeptide (TPR) repeat protein
MCKTLFTATAIAALLFAAPCLAASGMSMGATGGPGNYGGSMMAHGIDDYAVAMRLVHHKNYAEAVPFLRRALQQRPNSADVLSYLGYTHQMLGDAVGALDYYQRALSRDPNHKSAHEFLGTLYLKLNQLGNARGQLAELTNLCRDGCIEKDALGRAIADYELAAATPAKVGGRPAEARSVTASVPAAATVSGTTPNP